MATYKNTFTGFMAPISNHSVGGFNVNIDFSDPTHFKIHFSATPEALAAVNSPTLAQPELVTTDLQIFSSDNSLLWHITTAPFPLIPGKPLPIDFLISQMNGVSLSKDSVVNFTIDQTFTNFSYDVTGVLDNLLQKMPLSNGALHVTFAWTFTIIGRGPIIEVGIGMNLNTALKADKVLKDFLFTELAFSDGLHIEDFRRPFNSTSLTGSVDFQDEAGEINAHLPLSAYINPNGNVLGHLTNDANINDAAVEAEVVAGNWECKTLDLTIPTAEITGACADSFLIPTYTNTISGTVNLTAK